MKRMKKNTTYVVIALGIIVIIGVVAYQAMTTAPASQPAASQPAPQPQPREIGDKPMLVPFTADVAR